MPACEGAPPRDGDDAVAYGLGAVGRGQRGVGKQRVADVVMANADLPAPPLTLPLLPVGRLALYDRASARRAPPVPHIAPRRRGSPMSPNSRLCRHFGGV